VTLALVRPKPRPRRDGLISPKGLQFLRIARRCRLSLRRAQSHADQIIPNDVPPTLFGTPEAGTRRKPAWFGGAGRIVGLSGRTFRQRPTPRRFASAIRSSSGLNPGAAAAVLGRVCRLQPAARTARQDRQVSQNGSHKPWPSPRSWKRERGPTLGAARPLFSLIQVNAGSRLLRDRFNGFDKRGCSL
jgi:hypothetical protein